MLVNTQEKRPQVLQGKMELRSTRASRRSAVAPARASALDSSTYTCIPARVPLCARAAAYCPRCRDPGGPDLRRRGRWLCQQATRVAYPILAARDQHERDRAAALTAPHSPLQCSCLAAWQPVPSTRAATLLNAQDSNHAAHMRAATQAIRPNSLSERVLLTHVQWARVRATRNSLRCSPTEHSRSSATISSG